MSGRSHTQGGFGLIEVLVTLIIIAVGLLGLAGLQTRAQQAELEAYQRAQALVLLQDIAQRIRSNRQAARCYEIVAAQDGEDYIGQGNDPAACAGWGTIATRALADDDLNAWDGLLEGAAETLDGSDVGAMTGARGCIGYDVTAEEYTITVAWQGESVTQAPATSCAQDLYGDDRLRRVVRTTLSFPELD